MAEREEEEEEERERERGAERSRKQDRGSEQESGTSVRRAETQVFEGGLGAHRELVELAVPDVHPRVRDR